jgi:dolichol-phosphate mannosyltransferase
MGPAPAGAGVLVVIPTYDERENLPAVVQRLHAVLPEVHVLVVDDASPDGTGAVADHLARSDPRVQVLHRFAKEGLGPAYLAGFCWGLDRGYDVLVEMDADGSHAPEQLPALLDRLTDPGVDMVLGSRWVAGGSVVDWPRRRELLSRGGNAYARLMLRLPVRDATGGFRAYRRRVLEGIELEGVASAGYCFQVDLVWRAWRGGFHVAEVPIRFVERVHGESKMSRAVVAEALWRVTVWGVMNRRRGPTARMASRPSSRG